MDEEGVYEKVGTMLQDTEIVDTEKLLEVNTTPEIIKVYMFILFLVFKDIYIICKLPYKHFFSFISNLLYLPTASYIIYILSKKKWPIVLCYMQVLLKCVAKLTHGATIAQATKIFPAVGVLTSLCQSELRLVVISLDACLTLFLFKKAVFFLYLQNFIFF